MPLTSQSICDCERQYNKFNVCFHFSARWTKLRLPRLDLCSNTGNVFNKTKQFLKSAKESFLKAGNEENY